MADWQHRLTSDPNVHGGEMCAKGTHVSVKVILECLEDGASRDEILRRYPDLRPAHIEAALAYAAEGMPLTTVNPLSIT
ncbi:MAG: DUF433 domain-containing protein [Bryobacteraceae bacterium]